MKVIFLDVDGVLCTPLSHALRRLLRLPPERQCFDPVTLFWLRRLVRRTGAVVVLSSTWRDLLMLDDPFCRAASRNLFTRLARNGTPLADVTPMLPHGDKGAEIAAWLGCSACAQYVVLDDNDCFASQPEVRAHWVQIPDSRGLRRREARAALRQLLAGDGRQSRKNGTV